MLTISHWGLSDLSNWLSITELHSGEDHLSIFEINVCEVSLCWVAVGRPGPAEPWLGTGEDAPPQNWAGVSHTAALCCKVLYRNEAMDAPPLPPPMLESPCPEKSPGVDSTSLEWLSGVGVLSAMGQGSAVARGGAPCCPPFLVIHKWCRWLYLSAAPNTVQSWYLGLSSSPEIHPLFHTQGLKG